MSRNEEIRNHFLKGQEQYLRHLSVDCVIFGFHNNELKVLLLKTLFTPLWSLPGGFILHEEHLDDAAKRILKHRTGLDDIYLRQFHVFGAPKRSTHKFEQEFLKDNDIAIEESWMFERFLTIGYSALVDFSKARPIPDEFSSACEWFNINDIPDLILDHKEILRKALEYLRLQLHYQPVGYQLLPNKFTMPELQKLYETILEKKLDRRNFQRKMLSFGFLIKLIETKKGVARKAPYYFKFDLNKYKIALKEGMSFGI